MSTDLSTAVEVASRTPSFRLKGGLFPMTLLEVSNTELNQLRQDLVEKVAQAPAFFQQAPAVISLEPSAEPPIKLKEIIQLCLEFGLIVVALRGGSDELKQHASALNLALMPATRERAAAISSPSTQEIDNDPEPKIAVDEGPQISALNEKTADAAKAERAEEQLELRLPDKSDAEAEQTHTENPQDETQTEHTSPVPIAEAVCKIISTPVRSGQQIYAAGGDLIVLAPVSAGAELLADGNIHVYGPLRGRALAGVKGNTEARVFCQSQEAELISIAGCFMVDEDLRSDHWKQAVQVTLNNEKLKIQSLT